MNEEPTDSTVARALGAYAHSLREVRSSADLDSRMAASIRDNTKVRRPRPAWRRPLPWAIAAASVAAIATGVVLLLSRSSPEPAMATLAPQPQIVIPTNQVSLWPTTEAAVFRVKANLDTTAPASDERQYWVDVRVANDGSMRIVRVIPANGND